MTRSEERVLTGRFTADNFTAEQLTICREIGSGSCGFAAVDPADSAANYSIKRGRCSENVIHI